MMTYDQKLEVNKRPNECHTLAKLEWGRGYGSEIKGRKDAAQLEEIQKLK